MLVHACIVLAVAALGRAPLAVLVQVNTSGEESKYGVEPQDCVALARHIHESCKHLRLAGLMTIGMPGEAPPAQRVVQVQTRPGHAVTQGRAVRDCTDGGVAAQTVLIPAHNHHRLPATSPSHPTRPTPPRHPNKHTHSPTTHTPPRAADYSSRPENFQCLCDCRKAVADSLGLPEAELELR